MILSFRQLQVLHAVSRSGSVSGAAAALGVSQPAVSMLVRECARLAGFEVFVRRQGRLHPTAETAGLLVYLDRIFSGVDRVDHLIEDMRVTTAGSVHIAATPTLADNLLPHAVLRFQKSRPNVRITINAMDNLKVVDEVVNEHVDLGVALSPFTQGDVRQIELCAAELVCVVREDSPLAGIGTVTPHDLAEVPLISFRKTLPLGMVVDEAFNKAGVTQKIALEVNQSSVACALARAGAGAAIIDPFWLLDNRQRDLIRLTLRPRAEVSAQALVSRNTTLSRPARLFLAALRETAVGFKREGLI
jgi:DNA-binding transcriptional LysR family regulator